MKRQIAFILFIGLFAASVFSSTFIVGGCGGGGGGGGGGAGPADTTAPAISLLTPPPDPFGILTTTTLTWQSDEAGDYIVELGGTGTPGTGKLLASGSVAENTPVDQIIAGTQLSFTAATPLWIYVTDQVGHVGSTSVSLSLKPLVNIPIGGGTKDIRILPGGEKAYLANAYNDTVGVIDTDPLSPSFNSVISIVPVGINPRGIAITPDGTRAYVTNNGATSIDVDSISVISTTSDTVIATTPLGSSAPGGIAITPDGTRGYFTTFEQKVMIVDTDPSSLTYNLVIDSINIPLLLGGKIAITPDGTKAVVNWSGTIAHAVNVIDVDPISPTYNTVIGSPVPVIMASSGGVTVSPDSAFAYATDTFVQVCKIDLQTFDILISFDGIPAFQDHIALTPDGSTLLTGGVNTTAIFVFDTFGLTLSGSVECGGKIGAIAITPDGSRTYVVRDPVSLDSEVIMLPLL